VVGIVVVSHSEPLARAAVDLALQMVGDAPPPLEIAAGADGGFGTDAVAVSEAIRRVDQAAQGSGVLVISDLGSAVLSSELALEFLDDLSGEVLLSRAPFVEGLVAAVVQAAIGRDLAQVEAEAVRAAGTKAEHLGPSPDAEASAKSEPGASSAAGEPITREVEVVNPQGLHARPAALLVSTAATLPVEVALYNVTTGAGPAAADSTLELMTLGAAHGHVVRLSASGPEAAEALATLADLISSGLGEGTA
jgi:phosphotransferase system HPr (HPr) family protein